MNIILLINDIFSILGAICILYSYYMISSKKWNNNTLEYYIVNLSGAIFALIGITYRFNFSVLIIEIVFGLLSLKAIYRIKYKDL